MGKFEILDNQDVRVRTTIKSKNLRIMENIISYFILLLLLLGVYTISNGICHTIAFGVNTYSKLDHTEKTEKNCVDHVNEAIQEFKKNEIVIRLIIADDIETDNIPDEYIAALMAHSNKQFDRLFRNRHDIVKEEISIFFVDKDYWVGEKICTSKNSIGCNPHNSERNFLYICLTQNFRRDLMLLNHERAHAYFLDKPEIIAIMVEHLFDNNFDLSGNSFTLYEDKLGNLRFY